MLYQTKVEYSDWAMNHIQGCSHGCHYPCYAFLMARRFGRAKTYKDWCNPSIVDNTLELLRKELPKHHKNIKQVHLCFTTDPFMVGYPEVAKMSIYAIKLINEYDIPCYVLTKGELPSELADLSKINHYGITLVTLGDEFRKKMEPGAAPIEKRLAACKALSDAGCKTWVSMEPYPTPNVCEQELQPILDAVAFTDQIVFDRVQYDKRTSEYQDVDTFYHGAAEQVRTFCFENGIDCHVKKGTAD
ncbi:MAG: radical SAM protein [Coriobacteriaceae bacterium]|nr:radical SAM protein [Coriobacteriaceae bacterium]